MPKYKTHLLGGLITFFIIFLILQYLKISQNDIIIYVGACLLGSVFPDVDTKSKIQKLLYLFLFFISISAIIMEKWQFVAFASVIAFIPMIVNHRRLTHNIWFILITPLIIPIIAYNYNTKLLTTSFFIYIFFVGGAVSHIWLDFGLKGIFRRK